MNFQSAMSLLITNGKRVRRADWKRTNHIRTELMGGVVMAIVVRNDGAVGPWVPTHCDMMAGDWEEVAP